MLVRAFGKRIIDGPGNRAVCVDGYQRRAAAGWRSAMPFSTFNACDSA
jgi:hypothetical protein